MADALRRKIVSLYEQVGSPPFERLVEQANRDGLKLSKGSANNLVRGQGRPRWATVEAFVHVCEGLARLHRPPIQLSGGAADLDGWRRTYGSSALTDSERRWSLLAHGLAAGDPPGSLFIGRRAVLGELADWLAGEEPPALQVLVGVAGCGKSAILGRLVLLSDPVRFGFARGDDDPAEVAVSGRIDVAFHAADRGVEDLVREIAEASGTPATDTEALVAGLAEEAKRVVVIVDSLDEAQPGQHRPIAALLRKIAHTGSARVLVAVRAGSRTGSGEDLIDLLGPRARRLVVDSAPYFDRDDLIRYVRRRLVRQPPFVIMVGVRG